MMAAHGSRAPIARVLAAWLRFNTQHEGCTRPLGSVPRMSRVLNVLVREGKPRPGAAPQRPGAGFSGAQQVHRHCDDGVWRKKILNQ